MILKCPSDVLNVIVGFVVPADLVQMLYLVKEFTSETFILTVRSYLITREGTLDTKSFKYLLCFALRRELGKHDYYYLRKIKRSSDCKVFEKRHCTYQLKKFDMKKNFKQKELIDMIKKALINLKIKRALKFSSNIEIEKIAVHIIPVYDCDPALLSRLTETKEREDFPLLVSSSDGFAISPVRHWEDAVCSSKTKSEVVKHFY
jgi:hypothetical protein